MSQIAMNGDLAQIYRKATDGEELEPDESVCYTACLILPIMRARSVQ